MTDRIEAAIKNYRNHYNCSQSILCAWADKLNMNETSIYRLSEGFGAGMGMHETCGAITAILAILSYHCSDGDLGNGKTKAQTYHLELRSQFYHPKRRYPKMFLVLDS